MGIHCIYLYAQLKMFDDDDLSFLPNFAFFQPPAGKDGMPCTTTL